MLRTSKLINGNKEYKNTYVRNNKKKFEELAKGQTPQALFIGCSDSRVIPNLLTKTDPGEMFVMRNVGNFVPEFTGKADEAGVASALEYGVKALKVSEIIVCGHTHCGAIAALYSEIDSKEFMHVSKWIEQGKKSKERTLLAVSNEVAGDELLRATEKFSVITQMEHLLTYPFIKQRVEDGTLAIHGWLYDIKSGDVEYYDDEQKSFKKVDTYDNNISIMKVSA